MLPAFRVRTPASAGASRARRWIAATAFATAAVAVFLLVARNRGASRGISLDLGATTWRAPTDFLLETPGRDLLRGAPTVWGGIGLVLLPPGASPREDTVRS
jgi:hypothetical protein